MKYLKTRFNFNIKFNTFICFILLGISISVVINQFFLLFNIITIESVDKNIYYYIAILIRIVTSVIIGPFLEEIFFRGFIFDKISSRFNTVISMIITTILFSLIHISISGMIFSLILGIVLIYFYIKTKNLFIPYIIHASTNLASLFISFIPINILILILSFFVGIILLYTCDKNVLNLKKI